MIPPYEEHVYERIRALQECIKAEMPEPARSTLHEVCRVLIAVACPNLENAARNRLHAFYEGLPPVAQFVEEHDEP